MDEDSSAMQAKRFYSVLVPTYNERQNIALFCYLLVKTLENLCVALH